MMEEKMERASFARDRSGTAEGLAQPLTEEECAGRLSCFVSHPDAGGECGREAEMAFALEDYERKVGRQYW